MARTEAERDERRLRRSSTVAGVGDGVVAVALPLLAANLTRDPFAIAAVVAVQHLPWVLVHLGWSRLVNDRRTVIGSIDTVRALALGYLGFLSLIGHETIHDVQLVAFVVGLGEALTDGTEAETADVTGLSTRGMIGMAVVGLPLGGILYEIFPATPFLFEVIAFAGAALFALHVGRPLGPPLLLPDEEESGSPPGLPGTTAVVVGATLAGVGTSAVLGILVLFALDDLGLGAPAFGVLLAGLAACTAAGGLAAPSVGEALGIRRGLVACIALAAAGQATASQVADPARPLAGAVALGVAAGAAMVVAVLCRALLQRNAGRAVSAAALRRFHLAVWSSIPAGALLGGFVAKERSVHEVLLWTIAPWTASAVAVLVARPAEKSSEFV